MASPRVTGAALLRPENRPYLNRETVRCIKFLIRQLKLGVDWSDALAKAQSSYGMIIATQAGYELSERTK